MKRVLSFGEVLWDLFPEGKQLGGAPANFAYRINSLGGAGLLASAVGSDRLGEEALERLRAKGLTTDLVQVHPELATGTVAVKLSYRGEPNFHIVADVAYDEIQFTRLLGSAALNADCIYFGTLAQRGEVSRGTLKQLLLNAPPGAFRILDVNLRRGCYTPESVQQSLLEANLLKLNEQEVAELAVMLNLPKDEHHFAQEVCERWDLSHCLITRGENGLYARTSRGEECSLPGVPVKVVDTCGAGDAFTAGFVSQLLEGADLERCCRFGNTLGALVASTRGATSQISREEVERAAAREPACRH